MTYAYDDVTYAHDDVTYTHYHFAEQLAKDLRLPELKSNKLIQAIKVQGLRFRV